MNSQVPISVVLLAIGCLAVSCGADEAETSGISTDRPPTASLPSTDAASTITPTTAPSTSSTVLSSISPTANGVLVVERRPITESERKRINDGPADGLACDEYGSTFWDYGPIGPNDPVDRLPEDALQDAIDDMNADAIRLGFEENIPSTGWLELTRQGGGDSTFVNGTSDWRFMVHVAGDPDLGAWRHLVAHICLSEM